MDNQRELWDFKMVDDLCKIVDMSPKYVRIILGFLRQAASHIIHRNNPVLPGQKAYQISIIIRPGRIAMDHNNNGSHPLVEIMEPMTTYGDIPGDEWIFRIQGMQFN